MHAADWADAENYHNKLIAELMEFCLQKGLSSTAQGDKFTITLPTIQEIDVWPEHKKRKAFNIADWGPKGYDETLIDETASQDVQDGQRLIMEYERDKEIDRINGLPDDFQMPETGEILEEGEPPKGDPRAE